MDEDSKNDDFQKIFQKNITVIFLDRSIYAIKKLIIKRL